MLGSLTWNTDDPKADYDQFQDRFDGIVMTAEGGSELTNQCDEKLGRRRYEDTLVPLMILEDPDFDIKPRKVPLHREAPSPEAPWGRVSEQAAEGEQEREGEQGAYRARDEFISHSDHGIRFESRPSGRLRGI
jgi:hypothetical protein